MGNKASIEVEDEEKRQFIKKYKTKLQNTKAHNFWVMSKNPFFAEGEQEKYEKWLKEEFPDCQIYKLKKIPEISDNEWWDFLYVKLVER